MVAEWMLYFVLVSALLLGAGMLLEMAARRTGRPLRTGWAAAMATSALLPLAVRLFPERASAELLQPQVGLEIGAATPAGNAGMAAAGGWREAIASLDPILMGMWLGVSGLLLCLGIASAVRLRKQMQGWIEARPRPRVLISEATGPAVVGLYPGAIVLPRWAAEGEEAVRDLMLAHEEEHLRGGDLPLLMAAQILVVLFPWNGPLWWQLYRLRLATEIDCDARVLRRGSDLRSYATLLLEVGRRRSGLSAALAFAEPASFLERRIRMMTNNRQPRGWGLALVLLAAGVALVVGACGVDQPTEPQRATDEDGPRSSLAYEVRVLDRQPELRNAAQIRSLMERSYPRMLQDAGIGGRVQLRFEVQADGLVDPGSIEVVSTSHEQFASVSRAVVERFRFRPGEYQGEAVRVSVEMPITWSPFDRDSRAPAVRATIPDDVAENGMTSPSTADELTYEVAVLDRQPQLRNGAQIQPMMETLYPRMLQDAGIGGTVALLFVVQPDGTVEANSIRVLNASHEQLASVTRQIAERFRFTPGEYGGRPVRALVRMPVTWRPRSG